MAIIPGYTKTNAFEFIYYPYTHSLLMGLIWGALGGGVYWLIKKDFRSALIIGLCILSHWFFDLIVHTADLPLTPFSNFKVGFGLWNYVAFTLTLELVIFIIGVYVYATFTKARNKTGKWIFWLLAVLLLMFQFANTFGPPPSDSVMNLFVSFTTLMVIIIALAYWADKNREVA